MAAKTIFVQNQKGMATLETIPLLVLFIILLSYAFGSFGIIHTGILNSIAARTYAFETFRGRANTVYFRDNKPGPPQHYLRIGNRVHGTQSEERQANDNGFPATERPLRVGFGGIPGDATRTQASLHNERIFSDVREQISTQIGVSPAWVMTQYGLCINVACGGN